MTYFLQQVRRVYIQFTPPLDVVYRAIFALVFGQYLAAKKNGNHMTGREALFVCLRGKNDASIIVTHKTISLW